MNFFLLLHFIHFNASRIDHVDLQDQPSTAMHKDKPVLLSRRSPGAWEAAYCLAWAVVRVLERQCWKNQGSSTVGQRQGKSLVMGPSSGS